MKHPPKPFAVEIKRSRRSLSSSPAASSTDYIGKDKADAGRSAPALFAKTDLFSQAELDSDFAVPSFLQTDKQAHRSVSESVLKEAEQIFGPRPAAKEPHRQAPDGRPSPRILPSLIDENPALESSEERGASTMAARQSRTRKTLAQRPKTPPKADRIETADAATKRVAAETPSAPARESQAKRERASLISVAAANGARTAPTLPSAKISETSAPLATDKPRGGRNRSFVRRSREGAVSLPPGQQWKRRLHPRAW